MVRAVWLRKGSRCVRAGYPRAAASGGRNRRFASHPEDRDADVVIFQAFDGSDAATARRLSRPGRDRGMASIRVRPFVLSRRWLM
jgi:hypothetical protein